VSGTTDLATTLRVVASLVVVLAVAALAARLARRARSRGGGAGLRVVDRTGLSRDASLALVEVAGRSLVLGVTAQGVSVLTVLDNDPEPAAPAEAEAVPAAANGSQGGPDVVAALPPAVRLAEHPDLASALRAAGMVAAPPPIPEPRSPARTAPTTAPTTTAPQPRPAPAAPAPTSRRDALRQAGRPRRRQPSGAVLDPGTWRQALETLRDMTARRG
jgi:flagellar biogenesis protein FliO